MKDRLGDELRKLYKDSGFDKLMFMDYLSMEFSKFLKDRASSGEREAYFPFILIMRMRSMNKNCKSIPIKKEHWNGAIRCLKCWALTNKIDIYVKENGVMFEKIGDMENSLLPNIFPMFVEGYL